MKLEKTLKYCSKFWLAGKLIYMKTETSNQSGLRLSEFFIVQTNRSYRGGYSVIRLNILKIIWWWQVPWNENWLHWVAPSLTPRSFLLLRYIKWVLGNPDNLFVKKKLSPCSGSVAMRQLISIHKEGAIKLSFQDEDLSFRKYMAE